VSDAFYESLAVGSQVAASVLFIVVLVYLWIRFLSPAVIRSQESKNAALVDAERGRDAAKERVEAAQRELERAAEDVRAITARANRDAASLRARIVAEAHAEGKRSLEHAAGELQRGRAAARDALRADLIARALEIAREAASQVDDATNRRLVAGALDGAERGAKL
jgi:F0F1-type ATP synthase membrane subunit b/b'